MKKINLLLLLFVGVLGLTTISSCSPDEESAKPTISFIAEGPSITADKADLDINAPILFKMSLDQSIDTKKNIKTLKVTSISDNAIGLDTTIQVNKDNTVLSLNFHTPGTYSTVVKYTFTIEDAAGVKVTKTISITTMADPVVAAGAINTYSATLLGAQNNAGVGSFLDAHTGTVHLLASANTNSADIDVIFYYGNTNLATFAAPSDVTVSGVGTGNLDLAMNMTTKNATSFVLSTTTAAEFTAMTDDADFPTALTGGDSKVSNFHIGDVYEFETVDGKFGFIHVTALNTGAIGDVTIDIKIQD